MKRFVLISAFVVFLFHGICVGRFVEGYSCCRFGSSLGMWFDAIVMEERIFGDRVDLFPVVDFGRWVLVFCSGAVAVGGMFEEMISHGLFRIRGVLLSGIRERSFTVFSWMGGFDTG